MHRSINTWIVSPFIAPAVLFVGSALWYLLAFGTDGLVFRLMWQSILCFRVLLGSILLSPLLFLLAGRLKRVPLPRFARLFGLAFLAVLFVALFIVGQSGVSHYWLFVAFGLGLLLNSLVFYFAVEP